jgi:hypothetical protein
MPLLFYRCQEGRIPQFLAQVCSAFVSFPKHWLVSTERCLSVLVWPDHDLDSALQSGRLTRLVLTLIRVASTFFIIQIFPNMRSYMNLTVLALVASTIAAALSAPIR